MGLKRKFYSLGAVAMCCLAEQSIASGISNLIPLPDWLSISGETRLRYEQLDGQFRVGREGSDQGLFLRTSVLAKADFKQVAVVAELLDSRHILNIADEGSPLSTSTINPLDLLQTYVELPNHHWSAGAEGALKLGRFTMEFGSERLITRNGTRNTINSFAGADWQWQDGSGHQWRAFYTAPVQRRIDGQALDNEAKTDQVLNKVRFWGFSVSPKAETVNSQYYWLGLKERDDTNQATANRDINTAGARLWLEPTPHNWFYELETAYQWGEVNSSRSSTTRLDHAAYFAHAAFGYAVDHPSAPTVALHLDYISGDKNGDDSKSQTFDTLYGARRDDFGPTGIYGPVVRANLSAAGVFLTLKPTANTRARLLLQGYWLASDNDGLRAAGIDQASEGTGRYVGNQVAGRWRWTTLQNALTVDVTAAYLAAGEVLAGEDKGDTRYAYLAATYKF